MDTTSIHTNWLLIAVFIIGIAAIIGFFVTKTAGFGKFTTSTFLMLLIVILVGLFFSAGMIQPDLLSNVLFAVIGFAGGLFTTKSET
jgi:hypothetical protein